MLPLLLVNVDHKIHLVLPYSNLNEDVSCYKKSKYSAIENKNYLTFGGCIYLN